VTETSNTRAAASTPNVAVNGLFETHVTVARLEPSIAFYRDVVGLEVASIFEERRVAFFWIGGRGNSMLGVWEAGTAPNVMRLHLAFSCAANDVIAAPAKLRALGVEPLGFDREPVDEPVVLGWMPALSLYFNDPDGHLLEYLAMLPERPRPDLGVVPYSRWKAKRRSGGGA
jgi:lactoylglutathione lyase